jgi:hypothetical protein
MLRTARVSQPRVLVEDSAKRSPCGLCRRFVPTLAGDSLGGVGSPVRGASAGGSLAIVMSPSSASQLGVPGRHHAPSRSPRWTTRAAGRGVRLLRRHCATKDRPEARTTTPVMAIATHRVTSGEVENSSASNAAGTTPPNRSRAMKDWGLDFERLRIDSFRCLPLVVGTACGTGHVGLVPGAIRRLAMVRGAWSRGRLGRDRRGSQSTQMGLGERGPARTAPPVLPSR